LFQLTETNQTDLTVAVLIATRNRSADVHNALVSVFRQTRLPDEVVVLDDASDVPLAETLSDFAHSSEIHWMRSESPSGVSGARNKLTEAANSSILVYLDDDAVFLGDDAIQTVVEMMTIHPETGIVAFKIETPDLPDNEFQLPFRRRVARNQGVANEPAEVSYYVGAAHAIRREVFEICGNYPIEFVYGHEELDLSYRALNAGFGIRYDPGVKVAHYTRPSVIDDRGRRSGELYLSVRNRVWFAYRNLPARYAFVYVALWSVYYLMAAVKIRRPLTWAAALISGVKGLSDQNRNPINGNVVKYLKRHHGRLWM
jgi:GT2 family glycosyltransferase